MNSKIVKELNKLVQYYEISNNIQNKYRVNVYRNAVEIIKKYPHKIKNGKQIEHIDGIGESLVNKINEILKTGKLSMLNKLTKRQKSIISLSSISGIGTKKATELVDNYNIKTISELKKSKKNQDLLTTQQKIGLKYYNNLETNINRKEIEKVYKKIKKVLNKYDKHDKHLQSVEVIIAGGYYRGMQCMKDIDIILLCKGHTRRTIVKNDILMRAINRLYDSGLIIDTISCGKEKYMGILKNNSKTYHIDIHAVADKNIDYHLLYFTSGVNENRKMRQMAKKKGYILNEYGLFYKSNGKRVRVNGRDNILKKIGYQIAKS